MMMMDQSESTENYKYLADLSPRQYLQRKSDSSFASRDLAISGNADSSVVSYANLARFQLYTTLRDSFAGELSPVHNTLPADDTNSEVVNANNKVAQKRESDETLMFLQSLLDEKVTRAGNEAWNELKSALDEGGLSFAYSD